MPQIYPIEKCKVPVDFNAMIQRLKAKYPYLNGWYNSGITSALILGYKVEYLERYLDALSLPKKENPFGSFEMKIIYPNKEMVNLRQYRYAGKLRIKQLEKINVRDCSISFIEEHIEKMMSIIEEKRMEMKMVTINNRKKEMEKDFKCN